MDQPTFTVTAEAMEGLMGRFVIEPLPQGYGHTLGNALRRVLYSAIRGAAITSVKFGGVRHQFTSIEGVREDVVQLILSLKQVRLSYAGEKPTTITLSVKGQAEVTAGDFETPGDVTIANPELVIAHLTEKGTTLELEATVEAGYGYSPAEDRSTSTLGVIPVDATYSPVSRVNYAVESTRVGRVTNFDKLTLEITTDGTVSPADALSAASSNLVSYFSAVTNPKSTTSTGSVGGAVSSKAPGATISVEELDLPTRISNALQKAGFDSVASLLSTPKEELAKVKNLGGKSVKIIELALKERGFELAL